MRRAISFRIIGRWLRRKYYPSYLNYRIFAVGTNLTDALRGITGPAGYRTTLLPNRIDSVNREVITGLR